ncbi:MAG: response regulator [Acidimicrobiia bacterium]|nr:response regulator [Acidimicrobiia bacterium]
MSDPGVSIVLVDDDSAMRDLERVLFEGDGRFEVVGEAEDGAAAVRLVRALQPTAVVLDTMMPGMDGWDAMALIRRVAPSTAVVIAYTPDAGSELDDQSIWLGADGCVAKPDLASAPDAVKAACRRSGRRRFVPHT